MLNRLIGELGERLSVTLPEKERKKQHKLEIGYNSPAHVALIPKPL
jgi:hypothetical protein